MTHAVSNKTQRKWAVNQVAALQRTIKAELDRNALGSSGSSIQARLAYSTQQILELAEVESAEGRLKRYIYIVSALVHHSKFGGLSQSDVKKLTELAYAILSLEGIKPGTSRLAFLYGDLHLALSQIFRKTGDHWTSAWQQHTSRYLGGNGDRGGGGFQYLSRGIRYFRLGHAQKAIELFKLAEKQELTEKQYFQARLGRIRALRIAGDISSSFEVAEQSKSTFQDNSPENRELRWNLACCQVQANGNIKPMVDMVQKGRDHYLGVYLLEAFLWTKGISERKYEMKLPRIRSLARNKNLALPTLGLMYEACCVLENCYDYQIPIAIRLQNLGELLARTKEFVNLDTELLVWAAAARWLARSHVFGMADLVLSEYQLLSGSLTQGTNDDVLGIVRDLARKPWSMQPS